MKKILGIIIITIAAILIVRAFTRASGEEVQRPNVIREQHTETGELQDTEYTVSSEESILAWEGTGLPFGKRHYGNVVVSSGTVNVLDGNVYGEVIFDMSTITSEQGDMLNNDLKSSNFFNVELYPTSKFTITGYADGMIRGELTIKDVTRGHSFPVQVVQADDTIMILGETTINRLDWGIEYRSGTIFGDIGNQLVHDEVSIQVELVAHSVVEA